MRRTTLPFAAAALLFSLPTRAGEAPLDKNPAPPVETPGAWSFSTESNLRYSFVIGGDTDRKSINEQHGLAEFVLTARYNEGIPIRFGAAYERFSFSSTAGTRLPNTLQSVAVVAGFDGQIGESVFFRVEARPGWYSGASRILGDSFNVPIVIGASYLVSKDLQLALGVSIDPQRENVVLPGGGLRWQINDAWLANLILPRPRIEYKASDDLTVFVGGEVLGGTYRVDSEHGRRTGHDELDNGWLTYWEFRVGAGANYKASENIDVDFELGYMAYREAEFQRRDILVHSDSGGLYGGVSLRAKF